jgi:all-trans-retinol 13,14-reductase
MENLDTIVIGSGAGGLSAALCLARANQKVLVLEQHYVPGGWCHSFLLNGQRFSPGVHYIGQMDKGSSTSELFEALGIADDLIFFKMNKAGYEHCWIGDEKIDMPAGMDQLYESLSTRFPAEKKGLKKYLKIIEQVSKQVYLIPKMNGFWDNITIPFRTAQLGKYGLFSLKKVIDWHIKDPLLKRVLNVQCGDHGLPPAQASFPLHCAVMDHYMQGGFYPMGGGSAIVKAMTSSIKKHGGEVRTSQSVKRILIETINNKKRAVGVELESGEQIRAGRVVSNADPTTTYLQLIGKENLSKKLLQKLDKTTYSVTSLILFLTVDMDVRAAGMDSGNIWMLRNQDIDELYKEMSADDILAEESFPAVFISCTTLKDPASFNGRYHNIEVVTFIKYAPFEKFGHEDSVRSEEYLQFKKRITEKLLNNLAKVLPTVREHIVQAELGTPVTNEFYVKSTKGSVYGTEKNFKQTGPFAFSNKSEIENLYMCGASILAHGVGGATNSGIQTAAKILNCKIAELMVPQPGQQVRIYDAEDSTDWPSGILQKIEDRKRNFKEIVI